MGLIWACRTWRLAENKSSAVHAGSIYDNEHFLLQNPRPAGPDCFRTDLGRRGVLEEEAMSLALLLAPAYRLPRDEPLKPSTWPVPSLNPGFSHILVLSKPKLISLGLVRSPTD